MADIENILQKWNVQAVDVAGLPGGGSRIYPFRSATEGIQLRLRENATPEIMSLKHNFRAIVAPLVTDDISKDYSIGSIWVNMAIPMVLTCTDNNVGVAVWTPIVTPEPIPVARNGFIDYGHTGVAIPYSANTWTPLINDGGNITNVYAPDGVTTLMSNPSGEFDFSELDVGDTVFIRNDFTVTPAQQNAVIDMRYSMAIGSANPFTLPTYEDSFRKGAGIPRRFALKADMIYMGSTDTKDFPGRPEIFVDKAGTVQNHGTVVQVVRRTY